MNNKARWLSGLVAGAMLLGLTGCGGVAEEEETPVGTPVQVQTVERDTISSENKVSGKVISDDQRTIALGSAVKCTAVHAQAGDTVEAGEAICTLDIDSIQASYNAAAISYESSAQSYRDNTVVFSDQIALYQKNVSDLQALYAIGAASQTEIDQAELTLKNAIATRNATLSQLEAAMQSYKSTLEQLNTVLENVDGAGNVVAPISGTLAAMNAVENETLSASLPVAVIDAADQMKVVVSVSEAMVTKLAIGDSANVSVSAAEADFTATIRSVERTANPQTQLYSVTLTVPEGTEGLLSGMFADVTFYTDVSTDAVVVPTEAILTNGETQYVYVVEGDTARYVQVETGLTGAGVTEITAGLDGGEQLVTVGQAYLSDGAAVRVVSNTAVQVFSEDEEDGKTQSAEDQAE